MWQEKTFFFINTDLNIAVLYNTNTGEWAIHDIPFEEKILAIIERDKQHVLIQTYDTVFDLQLSNFHHTPILISHDPHQIQTDPNNSDVVLYLADGILYKYTIRSRTESIVLQNVSSFIMTPSRLYYCSLSEQLYTWDIMSLTGTRNTPFLSSDGGCPLVDLWSVAPGTLFSTGDHLYSNDHHVEAAPMTSPRLIQRSFLYYVTGSSLYRYDIQQQTRDLINRFSSPIQTWTTGPDYEHFFLASGNSLYFCDIKNNYCQTVYISAHTIPWIYYEPDRKHLYVQTGQQIIDMNFSFWQ